MLIIEGTDGVGKTTLAKKLLGHLPGFVYSHFTRLPPGFDYYWGYVDRISPGVVQDRFHMSEVAYARARGAAPGLDPFGYSLVDAALRRVGAFTVLITADEEVVRGRWDQSQMFDLGTTLAANREFIDLLNGDPRRPPRYRPDVDLRTHLTREQPYVGDTTVGEILARYDDRRQVIARLARHRPPTL